MGQIYTNLIADLEGDSRFDAFKLKEAKAIKPKEIGGLSIEGLSASPDGALLIGFRNPLIGGQIENGFLVNGKALVVKLLNPLEVIQGHQAKFDDPIELDLGGFGIRSLEYLVPKKAFLIVAGPYHDNVEKQEVSKFYLWSGVTSDKPELLKNVDLSGFNIESVFHFPQFENSVAALSDDGKIDNKKSFRFLLVKL